jgi:hypothetical protein
VVSGGLDDARSSLLDHPAARMVEQPALASAVETTLGLHRQPVFVAATVRWCHTCSTNLDRSPAEARMVEQRALASVVETTAPAEAANGVLVHQNLQARCVGLAKPEILAPPAPRL